MKRMSNPSLESSQTRLTDWLRPHLRWVTVPSWVLSALFHGLVAGLIVLLSQLPSCQADMAGDNGEAFRDVGIRTRPNAAETENETESESEDSPAELAYENPLTAQEPVVENSPPVALELPSMQLAPLTIGAGSIPIPKILANNDLLQPSEAGGTPTTSQGTGAPVSGGTSFLGIEDVGKRFAYVIDRSFSMDNDGALQAAKAELQASLSRLNETQQFQVIFYSGTVKLLEPRNSPNNMFWGTDAQRMQVSGRLRSILADGGTRHLPAIMKALEGNPDVIYLLTDGASEQALSAAELNQIKKRNHGGARIHCIEFGRSQAPALDGAGNFLRELAKQNNGQYLYRNVKRTR